MPAEKLAIITGTSSGIGEGLARVLLDQEWQVLGLARRMSPIEHPCFKHLPADLADLPAMERETIPSLLERINGGEWQRVALINNAAAMGALKPIEALTAAHLAQSYNVNALAATLLMSAVSRQVDNDTPLRVINVSTGAVHRGIPGLGDYCGSKAALRLSGMTLASEFEHNNRKQAAVFSYEPGVVDTSMQTAARSAGEDFPSQNVFKGFHESGMLQPVEAVLAPMVSFLEESEPDYFQEARFTPEPT